MDARIKMWIVYTSDTSTNVCSDCCQVEQNKLNQCIDDINRGYNRNYDKYISKRNDTEKRKVQIEKRGKYKRIKKMSLFCPQFANQSV